MASYSPIPVAAATPGEHVVDHELRLLRDGAEVFPCMLGLIARAQREVKLSVYWIADDEVGRRFAAALAAAAERGVHVTLSFDGLGSLEGARRLLWPLEAHGILVFEHGPIMPGRFFRCGDLLRRDHRKLLVVDREQAILGGINLAAPWLPRSEGGEGWRDDAVWLRGPVCAELAALALAPAQRPRDVGASPHGAISVLDCSGVRHPRAIGGAYWSRLLAARRRILLAQGYFAPCDAFLEALAAAARRGVAVRVLVPAASDVELVRHAGRARYQALLDSGVRLFEWTASTLHAKTALIDDWATVGSFNFDALSLWRNHELNVAVCDPGFARTVADSFERDFSVARELTREHHGKRGFGARLLERLGAPLRGFL